MKNYRSAPVKFGENIFIGENDISNDVQILRIGTFFHEGQTIEVKKRDLKTMVKNFDNKVRGIDLMLDFSHESEKEAAAWFETLYLSEDGKELWAKVEWTNDGAESVREKKYRYISADFNFAYKDNETLKDYGPTLLGAGLTNRPVVKNMNPTILSEENNNENKGKSKMEFEEKFNLEKEKNDKLEKELAEMKGGKADKELAEKETKLAEREKAVKLTEQKIEKDSKDAKKKTEFDTMLSEKKAVEAQRNSFMSGDMDGFIKNAAEVNFSEKGHGGTGDKGSEFKDSKTPAQDELVSLAEKKVTEDKISFSEAMSSVLSENKELSEKYDKEVEG